MHHLKISTLIIALLVCLGIVTTAWFWPLPTSPDTNTSIAPQNSNTTLNTNISAAQKRDQEEAEAAAKALWDPIIAGAERTVSFSYGGFTFDIPTNMVKTVGESGTFWTFPIDLPEGPSISFSQPSDSASNMIQSRKDSFSDFEKVVTEGTETINGQTWRYLEQTTDFGINTTYWFSERQPTIQVMYTEGRPEVIEVFARIIKSARAE